MPVTAKQKGIFLKALCDGYSIKHASGLSGHDRRRWYELRAVDEDFAQAWDEAIEDGTDLLEDEARRRAFDGVDEPVTFKGEITDTYKKYSDTLLIFLLGGRRPERFRQRASIEHTGKGGGPIEVVTIDQIDAEIARLRLEMAATHGSPPVPDESAR